MVQDLNKLQYTAGVKLTVKTLAYQTNSLESEGKRKNVNTDK